MTTLDDDLDPMFRDDDVEEDDAPAESPDEPEPYEPPFWIDD